MTSIEYQVTDARNLDLIRPLWNQLNSHHQSRSRIFQRQFRERTFDDRRAYFERIAAAGSLRLDLAFDPGMERYVGYCVSSLSAEKEGEIESIFVEAGYREQGVGSTLMTLALSWLDRHGSVRNRVSVGEGNEEAFGFNGKFGFSPRTTVLEQRMK
jgi:GNAT superfamily N-acetyltransferase